MPLYEFRCPCGSVSEQVHPLAAIPDAVVCPDCRTATARRAVGSPRLSRANNSAYQLIDATHRSAAEPEVVSRIPTTGRRSASTTGKPRTTGNPLHRRLPRP